jgi:hypothetical protein
MPISISVFRLTDELAVCFIRWHRVDRIPLAHQLRRVLLSTLASANITFNDSYTLPTSISGEFSVQVFRLLRAFWLRVQGYKFPHGEDRLHPNGLSFRIGLIIRGTLSCLLQSFGMFFCPAR